MVLMRRKDKRRGNASYELDVASDSSIVANKGVRSLRTAPTGRFAADMRVNVGGYGRQDKTWGVDHPWHQTQEDLFETLCAKDHMEEGTALKEIAKPAGKGESRAALKRMKKKLKKGMLPPPVPQQLSSSSEYESTTKASTEARQNEFTGKSKADSDRSDSKTLQQEENPVEPKARNKQLTTEKVKPQQTLNATQATKDKNFNAAKGKKRSLQDTAEKNTPQQQGKQPEADNTSPEQIAKEKARVLAENERLAKKYEESYGSEITTPTGLVFVDERLGSGKVVAPGQMVTVRYRGKLGKDGMVLGKGMLSFTYGNGSVIAGWEEGVSTMRSGGKRLLTIPPELAYGSGGKGQRIPPNTTLFFEVELVRIGKRKREVIGKDDIPLPSSFNRKKSVKATGNAKATGTKTKPGKKKRRRRD